MNPKNITMLHPVIDANGVLESSIDVYDDVILIGWTKEDQFSMRCSKKLTLAEMNLILDRAKQTVLS